MNPKLYEGLATQRQADLRMEAMGGHLVARARDDHPGGHGRPGLGVYRRLGLLMDRLHALRLSPTRLRRYLGAARHQLRQDVVDVAARGLRSDVD